MDLAKRYFSAVRSNSLEDIVDAINAGVAVDTLTSNNSSALMVAAKHGCLEAAELLITNVINIDAVNLVGETALLSAAIHGQYRLVRCLITHGACVHNVEMTVGNNVLIVLAAYGDPSLLSMVVQKGIDVNVVNNVNLSALAVAANNNCSDAVLCLVAHGANLYNLVHMPGNRFDEPLIYSTINKNLAVVKQLVSVGADMTSLDDDGNSAWTYAYYNYSDEITRFLEEVAAERGIPQELFKIKKFYDRVDKSSCGSFYLDDKVFLVIEMGAFEVLQRSIAAGIDVNMTDHKGFTLLMTAVYHNQISMVRLLIDSGADFMLNSWNASRGRADSSISTGSTSSSNHSINLSDPLNALEISVSQKFDEITRLLLHSFALLTNSIDNQAYLNSDGDTPNIMFITPRAERKMRERYSSRAILRCYHRWNERKFFIYFLYKYFFLPSQQSWGNDKGKNTNRDEIYQELESYDSRSSSYMLSDQDYFPCSVQSMHDIKGDIGGVSGNGSGSVEPISAVYDVLSKKDNVMTICKYLIDYDDYEPILN